MSLMKNMQKISQNMPSEFGSFEAFVLSTSPFQMKLVDDEKVRPSGDMITIPQRLSNLSIGTKVFGFYSNYFQKFYIVDIVG